MNSEGIIFGTETIPPKIIDEKKDIYGAKVSSNCYGKGKTGNLKVLYGLGIIFWTVLTFLLEMWQVSCGLSYIALLLPYFILLLIAQNLRYLNCQLEIQLFQTNSLSILLLFIIGYMSFMSKDSISRKNKLICLVALALAFISLMDIWINAKNLTYVRHIKTIFAVFALSLLLYVVFENIAGVLAQPKGSSTTTPCVATPVLVN